MKILSLVAPLALGLCCATANASLIGDEVTVRYVGAGDSGALVYTVGAGEEGSFFGNQFFDFGASSFTIRSVGDWCGVFSCGGSVALQLGSLDFGSVLAGVTFSTNLTDVGMSFTANSVTFNWAEQAIDDGTYLTANFSTRDVGSVPEPMSLSLLGLGLVSIAVSRRRAKV